MNKHLVIKLAGLFLACFFSAAQAIPLVTVQLPSYPANYMTTVGSIFDANIFIDSVPDFAGFDFTLSFDSTKLSALSLTSGNIFGAVTDFFTNSITLSTVNYSEGIVYTEPPPGLVITIPTLLATVSFQALSTGVNNLISVTDLVLSDWDGGDPLEASAQGAFVTIDPAVVPPPPPPEHVPEPASAFLFATGILTLFGLRRQKKTTS
ncbi:MAG: cohesin domain-containing protein [Candidatus Nitrotoga sp.]